MFKKLCALVLLAGCAVPQNKFGSLEASYLNKKLAGII